MNENATMAMIPLKVIAGIEIQYEVIPLNAKFTILKPGTTKVTIYRATA